jgi:RNA polymerase sigma factor (sigma-70 family)
MTSCARQPTPWLVRLVRYVQWVDEVGSDSSDRVGAAQLFASMYEPMCRLAYVILGDLDQAEEVVMDALVNMCRRWDHLDDVERSGFYLRRAVVNGCRSAIRSQGRTRQKLHRLRSQRAEVEVEAIHASTDPQLIAAIRRLPERQRACVALYYFEDRAVSEIASLLSCAEGTVKSQLAKARESIRIELERDGDRSAR